jgi:hypothetical protein
MCYNYNKAGYTCTEYPYPGYNVNLNKIINKKNNNSDIEEIQ